MSDTKPTAAAMRAAVALFGTGTEYGPEWLAKRAAKIDDATGLPELLEALRNIEGRAERLRENAEAEGHGWESDDAVVIRNVARAAIAKAEGRTPDPACGCRYDKGSLQLVRACPAHVGERHQGEEKP